MAKLRKSLLCSKTFKEDHLPNGAHFSRGWGDDLSANRAITLFADEIFGKENAIGFEVGPFFLPGKNDINLKYSIEMVCKLGALVAQNSIACDDLPALVRNCNCLGDRPMVYHMFGPLMRPSMNTINSYLLVHYMRLE